MEEIPGSRVECADAPLALDYIGIALGQYVFGR
jgi:hypothetical protein